MSHPLIFHVSNLSLRGVVAQQPSMPGQVKKAVVEGLAGPEGKKTSQVGWTWVGSHLASLALFLEIYNLPKGSTSFFSPTS